MNKAMLPNRVLGRVWAWAVLPFIIPAIPCPTPLYSLFLWSFNLHPHVCLFSLSFSLVQMQLIRFGAYLTYLFAQTLFLYQFILRYRGVRTSCIFGVGHNSSLNRWYPNHSLIQFFSWNQDHTSPYMATHSIFYIYFQIEGRQVEKNEETNSKITHVS